jgi:membrane protein implicated in regulation of membrane protease activity
MVSSPIPDSTEALAALYAAERTDVQNVLGHSLAMISILVAYAAVIGATWSTKPEAIPVWLTIFLPIPVLAAIAWHSQLNSLVFAHNQSIKILEDKLLLLVPSITGHTRLWVGATCGRLVTDLPILLKEKRIGMAAASLVAYGSIASVVLALTAASIVIPFERGEWQWLALLMAVIYVVIVILLGRSYAETFQMSKTSLDDWADSAVRKGLL